MVRYSIQIDYTTGDSFGSERTTGEVGCSWTDINKAKDALQRIKEHHDAYRDGKREYTAESKFVQAIKDKPWFFAEYGVECWPHLLSVDTDDGTPQQISAFWNGYFETLHSAEIIIDEPESTDMKVLF